MSATAAAPQNWRLSLPPGGIAASLLLHVTLLAWIVLGQLTPRVEAPLIPSVDVDLVSMAQFTALLAPTAPPPPLLTAPTPGRVSPAAPSPSPAEMAPVPSNGPFRATTFFAGSLLAEPASAKLRGAMGTLAQPERVVQLCDIEAMEQVRRARPDYDPDMVVPYAMADTELHNGTLTATGGAFRSRREWYEISFRCTPTHDLGQVQAFEFTLGAAIPHELWEAHYLTAEESDE